jgi:hypothetical protein
MRTSVLIAKLARPRAATLIDAAHAGGRIAEEVRA